MRVHETILHFVYLGGNATAVFADCSTLSTSSSDDLCIPSPSLFIVEFLNGRHFTSRTFTSKSTYEFPVQTKELMFPGLNSNKSDLLI